MVLIPEALEWNPHWAIGLLCPKLGRGEETIQRHSRSALSPRSAIWTQAVLHHPLTSGDLGWMSNLGCEA